MQINILKDDAIGKEEADHWIAINSVGFSIVYSYIISLSLSYSLQQSIEFLSKKKKDDIIKLNAQLMKSL